MNTTICLLWIYSWLLLSVWVCFKASVPLTKRKRCWFRFCTVILCGSRSFPKFCCTIWTPYNVPSMCACLPAECFVLLVVETYLCCLFCISPSVWKLYFVLLDSFCVLFKGFRNFHRLRIFTPIYISLNVYIINKFIQSLFHVELLISVYKRVYK